YLFPDQTFPLVWLAPLAVLDGIAELRGRPSIIGLVRQGRAGPVLLLAVAGLGTGILWELWNWGALPYWAYRIPYVGFLPVFEMPILGYLGYLPFILVADAFWRLFTGGWGGLTEGPVTDLGREGPAGRGV
ncbi:MAG TPA: mechanosensitive ion channel protein MscS, partial [Actinomycetota bacterium]|nr:mechanosensitive ion channel protein MscS [Actinomycetota bacterium]